MKEAEAAAPGQRRELQRANTEGTDAARYQGSAFFALACEQACVHPLHSQTGGKKQSFKIRIQKTVCSSKANGRIAR